MYQELVLPGFAIPAHPCPGCGKDVPRGFAGVFLPHSVRNKQARNDVQSQAIEPVQTGERANHLSRCPFQCLHPALLLACRSQDEVLALLAELGVDPANVGPGAVGT
ncbi:hypothetical protein ACFUEN_35230 [Streptomyces griseorubiginosus]|uniref:hypothetical protein n=1 Tax=Streptomyces griseorubiginosus TaxID=67304 RepID=UPI00362DCDE3